MDFRDFLRILGRSAPLVLFVTAAGFALAVFATAVTTPVYKATAKLYVASAATDGPEVVHPRGISMAERVRSYAVLVDSPQLASSVIDELGLGVEPDELLASVRAEAVDETVVLLISVEHRVPRHAAAVANEFAQQFADFAAGLEGGGTAIHITLAEAAPVPVEPIQPRPVVNAIVGTVLGFLLAVLLAVLREGPIAPLSANGWWDGPVHHIVISDGAGNRPGSPTTPIPDADGSSTSPHASNPALRQPAQDRPSGEPGP